MSKFELHNTSDDFPKDRRNLEQIVLLKSYWAELCQRRAEVAEQKAQDLGYSDALTGLPNRRKADHVLSAAQHAGTAGIIFIDIDHFKSFNDEHGHKVGDMALQHVAGIFEGIQKTLRENDYIARWGGEEFVVILVGPIEPLDLARLAEKFRKAIEDTPFYVKGERILLTASLGAALSQDSHEMPATVVDNADKAMYQSKKTGRNRVTVFDNEDYYRLTPAGLENLDAEIPEPDAPSSVSLPSLEVAGYVVS